jgi:Bacteriophage tail sheath protein
MPVLATYPGVYVQEIPSGVRTITGVATSVTAFIGSALRGPDDLPVTINNFGDFERIFGGLWVGSALGYAVRDFFLNGGGQAIVVRLYNAETGANPTAAASKLKVGDFRFVAASKGAWGANLRATIDTGVSADVAAQLGLASADLFNLTVTQVDAGGSIVSREVFRNLTVKDSARRVDNVLRAQSSLVRWDGNWPPNALPGIAANDDDVTKAQKQLAANPQDAGAQAAVTSAKQAMAASNGIALTKADNFTPNGGQQNKRGLYALERADIFNLLCIPPYTAAGDVDPSLISEAAAYCEQRRAMLLVDPPSDWVDKTSAIAKFTGTPDAVGTRSKNAALFYPRLRYPNPLHNNQIEDFVPCGAIAGVFARTDAARGIWKAPAGLDATLTGVSQVKVPLTDGENGELNQLGINCIRTFPLAGSVVWGARTLRGADQLADEYKYIPVRRTALYIESSLYRGLQWAVFEPNDEPLWAQIRLNIGAFMQNMFRQGAFQGSTPRDAYFVKCDKETTTQNDINLGVVNVIVGFAPLKPAEFVIITIQQMAGQIAT